MSFDKRKIRTCVIVKVVGWSLMQGDCGYGGSRVCQQQRDMNLYASHSSFIEKQSSLETSCVALTWNKV